MSRRPQQPPRALVDNMADEAQVAAGKEAEKTLDELRREAWVSVLNTYDGRFVIDDLFQHTKPFQTVHPGTSPIDPLQLAINTGRQDVGHFLFTQVQESGPTVLAAIMAEHHDREQNHA